MSFLVKVLYTFDDQTNCLARWPDILQTQTVTMEDGSTIGVIELKTCLQAVLQCSPELMARAGTDYTVYAYDYSECDTPLVGQGMLSRAMAVPSSASNSPASESGQLITGRICKNILGIFTTGVKETLEVKLRLLPVHKAVEPQRLDGVHRHSVSNESTEWSAFMQQNPGMGQVTKRTPTPNLNMHQRDGISMEIVNQLLSPQIQAQPATDPFNQDNMNGAASDTNGPTKKTSRPSSRASVKRPRARKPKAAAAVGGSTSGYEEGTDGDEGPAPKKRRAKVTKANQQNNNAFNTAPDSLRVAASTAGSLRMFRPIAMANSATTSGAGAHLQDIPRAPTPVPNMSNRAPSQVSLRRDSIASQFSRQMSTYSQLDRPEDEIRNSIESAGPSPEFVFSPGETPQEMGSSPPVMRTRPATPAGMRSSPPCASSPVLPQMPRMGTDSGFMSGSMEDLFGEDEEPNIDPNLYGVTQNIRPAPPRRSQDSFRMVMPGPAELLPTKMPIIEDPNSTEARARAAISRANSVMSEDGQVLPPLKKARAPRKTIKAPPKESKVQQRSESRQSVAAPSPAPERLASEPANSLPQLQPASAGSRVLARTASTGVLTLPTIPGSDSVLPPSGLYRSNTWSEAPRPSTEYMTMEADVPSETSVKFAAKKLSIKKKLEAAIRDGKMPTFCRNCGAIDTPTWRKAFSQEKQGAPGYHDYSDEPGRVTCIIILTRDAEGSPTSHKIIKKSLAADESLSDFESFLLCNRRCHQYIPIHLLTISACGIWMSKYKTQRPESRWETGAPQERTRAKKPKAQKLRKDGTPQSEAPQDAAYLYSEAVFPQSEAYYSQSEAMGPPEGGPFTEIQNGQTSFQNQARRGSTARPVKRINPMTSDAASMGLQRAIQSSPARWAGTRHSPTDIEEEDLGETRRLIFPSPRKEGSPKVLGEIVANVHSTPSGIKFVKENVSQVLNKENCGPVFDEAEIDEELVRLFEEEMAKGTVTVTPPRPTTPIRDHAPMNPFKTPTRPTPSHRPITRSVSRSHQKSPGHLLGISETPSRTLRRSPRFQEMESPFTRSLNQMMLDANNETSPIRPGIELDFGSLPALPNVHGPQDHMGDFNLEDFFSTDVPMPSSPPRSYNMYEDNALDQINWNDYGQFAPSQEGTGARVEVEGEAVVKEEVVSPVKGKKGDAGAMA